MIVFIFRRDLRVNDNIALIKLCEKYKNKPILPVFVFDQKQINPKINKYYSEKCVRFMLECLQDLEFEIGKKVVYLSSDEDLFKLKIDIEAVGFNTDLTPYAKLRDHKLIEICRKKSIDIITDNYTEYFLIPPSTMMKPSLKYGSFWSKYKDYKVPVPQNTSSKITFIDLKTNKTLKTLQEDYWKTVSTNSNLLVRGGRKYALDILDKIKKKDFKHYESTRNDPNKPTTMMSAYLKFGCISFREAYHSFKLSGSESLMKELYWRAFYDQVAFFNEKVLAGQISTINKSYYDKFDRIVWKKDERLFTLWKTGMTGFPLVDAGMRQMNATGFMHNRVRMVCASFLVKDLQIDWREGERYFANRLVDYHPSANNGGWTFVTGNGVDAQPYYRTFNPFLQSKKFDKEAIYIKKWVPELTNVDAKDIHKWSEPVKNKYGSEVNYPIPILDHTSRAEETKKLYLKFLK